MVEKIEYETYYDEYGDLRKRKIKSGDRMSLIPFSRLEKICIACLVSISIGVLCLVYMTYQNIRFNENLVKLNDFFQNIK